jgi:ribosomal protein S18 acetylase RimI-like enzyme
MVAHATQSQSSFSGIRPINIARDLVSVANLIELAFADEMDAGGRTAVRQMRWLGRLGVIFGWLEALTPPGEGLVPGFVWIENGQVVGNITVRRLSAYGRSWMIGNVAVAPGWRSRGIARSLMNASIDLVQQRGGESISLQVRTNNSIARRLYQSLNFYDVGETLTLERTQPDRVRAPNRLMIGQLRPARSADSSHIYTLAQSTSDEALRWAEPLYRHNFELSWDRSLGNWLIGTREVWRVIELDDQIVGAAQAQINRWTQQGQLNLWVAPEQRGKFEPALVDAVLAELNTLSRSLHVTIPARFTAGYEALLARGFSVTRALSHMRLDLKAADTK